MGTDILIYNYIGGGGHGGMSGFQFDLRSKKGIIIKLPFSDAVSITATDGRTTDLSQNISLYLTYKFLYSQYHEADEPITDDDFALKNMFKIAADYYRTDDYTLAHQVLMNYEPDLPYEAKRLRFYNLLAAAMELEHLDFEEITGNLDPHDHSQRDFEETMLDAILEEMEDDNLAAYLFETFINIEGDKERTLEKFDAVFGSYSTVSTIENEVLQPEIKITASQKMHLSIPEKYISYRQRSARFIHF